MPVSDHLLRKLELLAKLSVLALLRLLFGTRSLSLPLACGPDRVLVIRQHNQLGDMLCAVPLLRALRQAYPAGSISLLTSPVNHAIMLHSRFLDDVIEYDKRRFLGRGYIRPLAALRFLRHLRSRRFDLVIVPSTVSTSVTSDILARITGAPFRIGAGSINRKVNPSSFLYNVRLDVDWPDDRQCHQTERNLQYAAPLGIKSNQLHSEIVLTLQEINDANTFNINKLNLTVPTIMYHPGAGKTPNRWPAERFAEVARELHRKTGYSILIICGPMDDGPVAKMAGLLGLRHSVLREQPIRMVAAILSRARLLISNDTGIMHVGAAVGAPVLSLFGPTFPEQWAPKGPRNRYIKSEDGKIESIRVDQVLSEASEMLREGADGDGSSQGKS
jgi:heptosyltransferase-2